MVGVNAKNENFELVEVDGRPMLFTHARVDRDSVPDGLHCYDVRHDDDGRGISVEIKPHVTVNHWGTILSKAELPLKEGSYFPKDDFNYLGDEISMDAYLKTKQIAG